MSGWVPMPADGWAETAELLTSTGKPWPEQAVIADLRWFADPKSGSGPLPGRPALVQRWHWGEKRVRLFLASPERWWDPARGTPPTSRSEWEGPAEGQRRASLGPAEGQGAHAGTPEIVAKGPVEGQGGANEGPARVHTRRDPPAPTPSPPPTDAFGVRTPARNGGQARKTPATAAREAVLAAWKQGWEAAKQPAAYAFTKRDKQALSTAIAVATDPRSAELFPRAAVLYAEACMRSERYPFGDPPTLHWFVADLNLWLARAADPTGHRPRGPPAQPRRGQSTAGDGVLDEVRRRLERGGNGGDDGRGARLLGSDRGHGADEALD